MNVKIGDCVRLKCKTMPTDAHGSRDITVNALVLRVQDKGCLTLAFVVGGHDGSAINSCSDIPHVSVSPTKDFGWYEGE